MADLFDEAESLFATPTPTATPAPVMTPLATALQTTPIAAVEPQSFASRLQSYIPALETVAQEGTGLAGSLVGAKFGTLAGAPLAPFTFGLSVPAGGILGGALGYFGGSTLGKTAAEIAAGEQPDITTTASEQISPALTGAALEAGLRTLSPIGGALVSAGKGAKRAAFGFRQGDYVKTLSKRQAVKTAEGETISLTQKQADNVIEKGLLGDSSSPSIQLTTLDDNIDKTNDAISALLQNVKTPVKTPQFIDVVAANQKGVFGSQNEQLYASKIAELKNKLNSLKGPEKLQYMQNEKKFYGAGYSPTATTADKKFNRAMYHELQAAIEQYAPEVKALNKDLQGLMLTRPVIMREQAKEASGMLALVNAARTAGFTTGGYFGAGAQNVLGPIGGAALGLGGAFLASRPGKRLLASALETGGQLLPQVAAVAEPLAAAGRALLGMQQTPTNVMQSTVPVMQEAITEQPSVNVFDEAESLFATPEPVTTKVGKQNISIPTGEKYAPASLVKAVMKVESGGKQEAVSSKGARGLMQLMPATARDLGVDAKDPKQNVEGGSRYLAQQLSEFGSEELALAAYNWGPNNIKRAMAKVRAEGKRPTWANIKAYVKVPKETREYVDKVLSLA